MNVLDIREYEGKRNRLRTSIIKNVQKGNVPDVIMMTQEQFDMFKPRDGLIESPIAGGHFFRTQHNIMEVDIQKKDK